MIYQCSFFVRTTRLTLQRRNSFVFLKICPMYLLIWVIVIEKKCFIDMKYDTGHWFIASKWQHLYIYYFPIPDPFFTFAWVYRKRYQTDYLIQNTRKDFKTFQILCDPDSVCFRFCLIHIMHDPHSAWS